MQKTIDINGSPFVFEEESITYENNFAITEDDAREILLRVKTLFDNVRLPFYLGFGTLLGAVRDQGLIKGDEDVDVFIDDEERLRSNLPYFYNENLKLVRYEEGNGYSFRLNERCYIDVYIRRPLEHGLWSYQNCLLCGLVTPKKYFEEYQPIDFLGIKCLCPKNPERLLEFWYGRTWRIPIRGHKFYYEVRSHYYWKHRIRPFLLTLAGWPIWRHALKGQFNSFSESVEDWKEYIKSL